MSPAVSRGAFAPDRLTDVLRGACGEVGLDVRGAELLRLAANAVFLLPGPHVVVRISTPRSQLPGVRRTVQVARWLGEIGFPAVRLHGEYQQPVVVGDYLATFWDYLPPGDGSPSLEALARLLRQLHPLTPPFPLPRWDPVTDARQMLARGDSLAQGDRAFLEGLCDQVEAELALLAPALPAGVIHGDAWQGNLLAHNGSPVLCDLDQVSAGPREWDLVPTIVNGLRFGYPPGPARRFLQVYGFDVTLWHGFPALRRARELVMLAGVAPVLSSSPLIAQEFTRRLDGLRTGQEEQWTPYGARPHEHPDR
jgi:aminoglycoside phosphotransferase (APT) family kinase protein